ncbi:MAG: chemotaxis protein CheD [Bdellovibrionales bacterium]
MDQNKPINTKERRIAFNCDAYFNNVSDENARVVYLDPGQHTFVDSDDQMIVATLGAGVLVSVYDVDMRFGACAYVLLPDAVSHAFPHFDTLDSDVLNAAFAPIEACIGELKRKGAGKNRIRIRLNGGARIRDDASDKGTKNYVFVREFLTRKGLFVMNEDLGGHYVRRVHFFPTTGRSVRWMLRRDQDLDDILSLETTFQKNITESL